MNLFENTLKTLNRIKARTRRLHLLLTLCEGVVLAVAVSSVWALVQHDGQMEQLILGALVFVTVLWFRGRFSVHPITANDLLMDLEIRHGNKTISPTRLREDATSQAEQMWAGPLGDVVKETRGQDLRTVLYRSTSLAIPTLISMITLPQSAPSLTQALQKVQQAVASLQKDASLVVIKGALSEEHKKGIELVGGETVEVELLAQNLVEVSLTQAKHMEVPILELRPQAPQTASIDARKTEKSDQSESQNLSLGQSFQLLPTKSDSTDRKSVIKYSITFSISEDSQIFLPALSTSKPVAAINVKELPVPKVSLKATSTLEDPWPDDQPLGLRIQVKAQNPLQLVRLEIRSGRRISHELVVNVMSENKLSLAHDYRLTLEPYVESDLAKVSIVAEAVDRAVPTPLVGRSRPLNLNTASAYGRYRQTLSTLRELKQNLDEALKEQDGKLDPKAGEIGRRAAEESERSPFFDARDRMEISRFQRQAESLTKKQSNEMLMDLSHNLGEFLFEHEMLDSRERDRDFFVAARGLSRLIEQSPKLRPVAVSVVTDRIKQFLDDRHKIWEIRVGRIEGQHVPPMWSDIKSRQPFHATMDDIKSLDIDKSTDTQRIQENQLKSLSKAVGDYRVWIEELEKAEDKMREERERKRQEGLANARNEMKELQKRQGEVSQGLDRAAERDGEHLATEWPSMRMKQNANFKQGRRLEGQIRALSPTAGARIKAAIEAMARTMEEGDAKRFVPAESNSDFAGRLLRQAQSAAAKAQSQKRNRGRRRRVTGDNYYGQSIVGGDIEIRREYQVDRRYREDIMDEVRSGSYDTKSQEFLENYLREVVR